MNHKIITNIHKTTLPYICLKLVPGDILVVLGVVALVLALWMQHHGHCGHMIHEFARGKYKKVVVAVSATITVTKIMVLRNSVWLFIILNMN